MTQFEKNLSGVVVFNGLVVFNGRSQKTKRLVTHSSYQPFVFSFQNSTTLRCHGSVVDVDIVYQAEEETLLLFSFFPFFNHICKRFSINFQESGFYIELSIKLFEPVQPMIVDQVSDK